MIEMKDIGFLGMIKEVSVSILMLILSWNLREICRREEKKALRRAIQKCKLNFVFVQEIKIQNPYEGLYEKLWHKERILGKVVKLEGRPRGLLRMWQKSFFNLEKNVTHRNFILLARVIKRINTKCGWGT